MGPWRHPDIYGGPPAEWPGTDLSNDHPVALPYPTNVPDPAFNTPPSLSNGWTGVPLFDGRVECASCHNPHDPTNPSFLRVANAASALQPRHHAGARARIFVTSAAISDGTARRAIFSIRNELFMMSIIDDFM